MPVVPSHSIYTCGPCRILFDVYHGYELNLGYVGDGKVYTAMQTASFFAHQLNGDGRCRHIGLHPEHAEHNLVEFLRPRKRVVRADAVIFPRQQMTVGILAADCASVVITDEEWVAFAHIGRPELTAEPPLITNLFKQWPGNLGETKVHIGPMTRGVFYQFPNPLTGFEKYRCKTIWFMIPGLDLERILADQLRTAGVEDHNVFSSPLDPFYQRLMGEDCWASDQFCRRFRKTPTESHRDLHLLRVF